MDKNTKDEIEELWDVALDEIEEDYIESTNYKISLEMETFRDIIERRKNNGLQVPSYQRRFVWSKKQQNSFLEFLLSQMPLPPIVIAEYKGVFSLIDGLQRITTQTKAYIDPKTTESEKTRLLETKTPTMTIYNMPENVQRRYFNALNSSKPLSRVIKERSNLPDELLEVVLKISELIFTDEMPNNASFDIGAHYEIIVESALLFSAGVFPSGNQSKEINQLLVENTDIVLKNSDNALAILSRIKKIITTYLLLCVAKRALSANYLTMLTKLMVKQNVSDKEIVFLTNSIFAQGAPIKKYSDTLKNGRSEQSCVARYGLLEEMVKVPVKIDNEDVLKREFDKFYKDANISEIGKDSEKVLDYNSLDKKTSTALLKFFIEGDFEKFNQLIKNYKQKEGKK